MHLLGFLSCHPLISVAVLLLTLFVSTCLFRTLHHEKPPLPPSPPRLPLIGNIHQLGGLPHRSLYALSKRYGPIMLLQLGQAPTLVVSSPELAKEVMKSQDHVFANRPSLIIPRALFFQGKDIAFAPYGEYWRQLKKFAVLNLLSNKKVQSYRTAREEDVASLIDKVRRLSSQGTIINLTSIINTFAEDYISRVAVGESSSTSPELSKIVEDSTKLLGSFHWGDYFPWLAWLSKLSGLDNRVKDTVEKGNDLLDSIIGKHEATGGAEETENKGCSFLDVLLSLEKTVNKSFSFDKKHINANLKDALGAGTDSTSITTEWIMAELLHNSDVMRKLKEEIRGIVGSKTTVAEEHLAEMNYLRAVIKETFRLHPPGPLLIPRESMEETAIHGYRIPKCTRVLVNVWAIGRDPDNWEDPENFLPERFTGSYIDYRGCDYELTPFGAGRRICPGIQFSMTLIELAVANLVHQFDWKMPGNMKEEDMDMEEVPGLACRKKINLQVTAISCL